jgi:hypothetical protein
VVYSLWGTGSAQPSSPACGAMTWMASAITLSAPVWVAEDCSAHLRIVCRRPAFARPSPMQWPPRASLTRLDTRTALYGQVSDAVSLRGSTRWLMCSHWSRVQRRRTEPGRPGELEGETGLPPLATGRLAGFDPGRALCRPALLGHELRPGHGVLRAEGAKRALRGNHVCSALGLGPTPDPGSDATLTCTVVCSPCVLMAPQSSVLASVDTPLEANMLLAMIREVSRNSRVLGAVRVWLGARASNMTLQAGQSAWLWEDGSPYDPTIRVRGVALVGELLGWACPAANAVLLITCGVVWFPPAAGSRRPARAAHCGHAVPPVVRRD